MRIPQFKLKILVLALVAVAGATATVALASPRHAADNRSDVQKALTKTSKVPSGQFAFTFKLSGGGVGSGIAITGTGGFDTKHQVAVFTVNLGALSQLLAGASGGAKIPQTLNVVAIKDTLYVRLPSVASQIKPGAQWLKFDSSSTSSLPGGVKPPATTTTDPKQALKVLNGALVVHKSGSTTVRGTSTTHYTASVDVVKVVNGLVPKKDRASTLKSLQSAGIKSASFDVYVDGSGLVRRVSGGLKNLKLDKGTPALSVLLSVDLYAFGHPVKATAPPAGKTADGAKLLDQIAAGLGGSGGGGG
jgi:hypothetical protein